MSDLYRVDAAQFEELVDVMLDFADGRTSEKIINDTLLNEGATLIKERIQKLLPVSGKTWKGKKAAAKSTQPFIAVQERNLSVTVKSKKAYQYLYFPDDGTNTHKHAGNQQFMRSGAEKSEKEIINLIIDKILKKMEGN